MFVKLHMRPHPNPSPEEREPEGVVFYFKFFQKISFCATVVSVSSPGVGDRGGHYLSISGITKSNVPIIATRSPSLPPLAIVSNAERLENPGERNLIR